MRKLLLSTTIIVVAATFIARLAYLQLIDNTNKNPLDDTAIKAVYDYPGRGYIFDRNGELLVSNQPSYDVMVIPKDVKPFDTLEFCNLLSITKEDLLKILHKAKTYSPRLPSVVIPQLSKADYAALQEKMRKYDGFYIQKRTLRSYSTAHGANILGYISEVNDNDLKNNPYYQSGEIIGRQGVERQYEEYLRGRKGVKFIQKDRFNRDLGPYKNGMFDTLAVQGQDIQLTIDNSLQAYGEQLMVNKRGGIVAIEPKTGEILALVSAPSYDPALLVGRQRSKNYTRLYYDSISKPLYDRGLLAEYPPGSPFKIVNALIGLEEGVIDLETSFSCGGGYRYGGRILRCHCGRASNKLETGIPKSCNAYFCNTYRRIIEKYPIASMGMDAWERHVKSFGFGDFLGTDLPAGRPGKIPNTKLYDRIYGEGRWGATYNISNAIGQGEIVATPLQLANMAAIVANRGYYYTPHVVKKIDGKPIPFEEFTKPKYTTVSKEHFEPVVKGMWDAFTIGTARGVKIDSINIGGKTGTAENFAIINGKRVQLTDHSIFVAFAPVEDPKIAIAVFVENGYYGARVAAPVAALMIEKYIKGKITRTDLEKRMLEKSLEAEYAKPLSGKPFRINE